MGFFSRKKETDAKAKKDVVKTKGQRKDVSVLQLGRDLSQTIIKPRITEKAVKKSDNNVYTFEVRRDATKYEVRDAVKEIFSVTPVRVNIVNKAPRRHISAKRGRMVTEKGMKKAYVYLKEGDTIDLA